MNLPPETLVKRHNFIVGKAPTDDALLLYRRFPAQRGYAIDGESDPVKFEAAAVLALAHAFEDKTVRVVFFVSKPLELWAIGQFKAIAKGMFGKLQVTKATMPPGALQTVKDLYQRIFGQVMIGSEPTREAPKHWVAYGFMEHDPRLPPWLREGLM